MDFTFIEALLFYLFRKKKPNKKNPTSGSPSTMEESNCDI